MSGPMHLDSSLVYFVNNTQLQAGFTTKTGGLNPSWGLNLGLNTGQPAEEVSQNRKEFACLLGPNYGYAFAKQIHSNDILEITTNGIYTGVDGLITREKHLVLNILTADCLGIIAADVHNQVLGVFHAGWKGTAGQIAVKGIEKMLKLGAQLNEIQIFIAPGIKCADYEVGEELTAYFPASSFAKMNGRLCLDLERENIRQLKEYGLTHITTTSYSTYQEAKLYSYRREGLKAGRFATFAVLI